MTALTDLIGESPAITAIRERVGRVLQHQSDARRTPLILIGGETGTGKGLLARAIHRASKRATAPFLAINCAAIPEPLLESELFGHERGAFTDARQARPGLFQAAHGGTLFLDEIGLLPLAIQAKLLNAIDERSVRRLGSTRSEAVDVQIVAATNEDLPAAIRARRFREDLYHRLSVVTLWLPPLRERGRDVVLLAEHYLAAACTDYQLQPKTLTPEAQEALLRYSWPGNVRELINVLERVALLAPGPSVDVAALDLPDAPPPPAVSSALSDAIGEVVRDRILDALRTTRWNITRAAAILGMPRNTLRYQIEKHRLRRDGETTAAAPGEATPATPSAPETAEPALGLGARSAFFIGAALEALRSPSAGEDVNEAGEARAVAVPRWERRHVALLRATLMPAEPQSVGEGGRLLETLVEKAHSFGARIEELARTGIVAVFGLEPVEDAPRRAGLSAMAMQNAVQHARALENPGIALTVGIHTCHVMTGRLAGTVQIEEPAKRQAWSTLDRLVALAHEDTILVSQAAVPSLERRFDIVPFATTDPVETVFHLTGRHDSGVHRRMPRFVGRRRDLDVLADRLASVARGHGQVVGIVGDAGIGKSRLLFEFRQRLAAGAVRYLEGSCFSHGSTIPYLPVADILRQSCELAETESADAVAEKLHGILRSVDLAPEEREPYLLHVLGLKDRSGRLDALSPEVIKSRTFETLRQLALALSRVRPLFLVVEDFHWVDRTSEEYFASLIDSLADAAILFVAAYRPGYRPAWIGKSYATEIALPPLDPQESLRVLSAVLEARSVSEEMARLILDKAEGNPFFLEELARSVSEQGASPGIPDTIHDVLVARVDRLAEQPRRLLQTASILGREVSPRLLREVWDGPGAIDPHLADLTRLEFLHERSGPEGTEYAFKHTLIQEVVYETLLAPRRQALHGSAARALERLHAEGLEDVYDQLAHHYARTEDAAKAVDYLTRSAEKAVRRHAHVEAIASLEEALRHAERVPENGRDRLVLTLGLRLAHSLNFRGRFTEALDLLLRSWARLERVDDAALTGVYCFWRSRFCSVLGDHEEAARHARTALAEATRAGDLATVGKAHFALAYEDFWSGRVEDGVVHAASAVSHFEQKQERWWTGQAYWVASILAVVTGEFEAALESLGRMRRIGERIDDPRLLSAAAWTTGGCHSLMGDWEAGIAACRRGLQISINAGDSAVILGFLGGAYVEKGDHVEAVPVLQQSVQQCVRFGIRDTLGWFTTLLGEAYLLAARLEEARARARDGLRITTETGYRFGTSWAQRVLGRIALVTGDLAEARARLDNAARIQQDIRARHELGRTYLELARLAHREGDRSRVRTHLDEAQRLFVELRVPRYVARTRVVATELDVEM